MPNDMAIPLFMGMWIGMMVAMICPTVAPLMLAHRVVVQRRGQGFWPTAAFVSGYLLVRTALGVVPLVVFLWFRDLAVDAISQVVSTLGGGVLVVSRAYEFSGWKALCLRACRSPLPIRAPAQLRWRDLVFRVATKRPAHLRRGR